MRTPRPHRPCATRRVRGNALIMVIILSVAITAIVASIAWTAGAQAQSISALRNLDQAFFAAEGGEQRVAWFCKHATLGSISSPLTGSLNGYSYSSSWTTVSGSTIRITSTAALGSVSYTCYQTVAPPAGAPPVYTHTNLDFNHITINGDLAVQGSLSNSGNGVVNGNVTYTNALGAHPGISGSLTQVAIAAMPTVDMAALRTTLIAAAGVSYSGNKNNFTFDFTALPGTNKVIYVNGGVANATFIGAGTLLATNNISVGSVGTASEPVNLVSSGGGVSFSNGAVSYGSVYMHNNGSASNQTINGVLYGEGGIAGGASSLTVNTTAAPWFDTRSASGSGTTTFSGFAGPQP